jgi:hypothetical protein
LSLPTAGRHRAELPGKANIFYIVPLALVEEARFEGHAPAILKMRTPLNFLIVTSKMRVRC